MIKTIVVNVIIFYVLLFLLAFFFADKMIFLPPKANYHDNDKILKIRTNNGSLISAVYLPNKNSKYTILVSHGNAEDLGFMYPFLQAVHNHGFSVFAYDYEGYGTSQGKPSEKNSYIDIDAAYNYLTQVLNISPENIILYGRSIGAAVALDLAIRKNTAGLIMEAPFLTAFRVVTYAPILPFDEFNNFAKISKLNCPLLIIHGVRDSIVPIWHGKKLYEKAAVSKSYYWVLEAGHNNIVYIAGNFYWQVINDFVKHSIDN